MGGNEQVNRANEETSEAGQKVESELRLGGGGGSGTHQGQVPALLLSHLCELCARIFISQHLIVATFQSCYKN